MDKIKKITESVYLLFQKKNRPRINVVYDSEEDDS